MCDQLTCTKNTTKIRRFHPSVVNVLRFLHHQSGFHRSGIRSAAVHYALMKPSSSKLPSALVAQSSSNNRKCNARDSPENHVPRRQGAMKVGACATPAVTHREVTFMEGREDNVGGERQALLRGAADKTPSSKPNTVFGCANKLFRRTTASAAPGLSSSGLPSSAGK